jgi:hypothetical protein
MCHSPCIRFARALLCAALPALLLAASFDTRQAAAHEWFSGKRNAQGLPCCTPQRDCRPVEARVVAGGYLVDGVLIPESEAQPSQDDRFHICVWGGKRRCFFAPMTGV